MKMMMVLGACSLQAWAQVEATFPYACKPCESALAKNKSLAMPKETDRRMVIKGEHWPADKLIELTYLGYKKSSFARYYVIPIKRAITASSYLNFDGSLKFPQSMVDSNIVSKWATVTFPMARFDTSIYGTPNSGNVILNDQGFGYTYMAFNGHKLSEADPASGYDPSVNFKAGEYGKIVGPVNEYKLVMLKIPIAWVNYPKPGISGAPEPAKNYFAITTPGWGWGPSFDPYRTDIPWISLEFDAMAPIMMVHGTNSDPATWNVPLSNSFNDFFKYSSYIYFNDIALAPNVSVGGNGDNLEIQITDRLARVGAKHCHIIAHSKGGNDSRSMIYYHYNASPPRHKFLEQSGHFQVLSLYNLETPHRGTVIADISYARQNAKYQNIVSDPNWPGLQNIIRWDFEWLHTPDDVKNPDGQALAPTGPALRNNQTLEMAKWNRDHYFNYSNANTSRQPISFYNTATDSDWNTRNLAIDRLENAVGSTDVQYDYHSFTDIATTAYQMLYWAKRVDSRPSSRYQEFGNSGFYVNVPVTELYVPASNPINAGTWNDLVVAIDSALFDGATLACPSGASNINGIMLGNHSGIKTRAMAAWISEQIRKDWKLKSDGRAEE